MQKNRKLALLAVVLFGLSCFTGGFMFAAFGGSLASVPNAGAQSTCQDFSETGFKVCGRFLEYWKANGGLAQQGFPISGEFKERQAPPPAGDGKEYTVQYFQRARFELHPENKAPYDVLLGLLGAEQYTAKYGQPNPAAQLIKANGLRMATEIKGQFNTYKAKDGFVFLVVDFTLTNTTGSEISANPLYLKVKSDKGFVYEYASFASSNLEKDLKLGKLAPNESVRAELAFEVPAAGENIISLIFEDFKNKAQVSL